MQWIAAAVLLMFLLAPQQASAQAVGATTNVATASLTQGVNVSGFTPVSGNGGTVPYIYSISPLLPTGLTISAASGLISGTPSAASAATQYTVTVTDATTATATGTFQMTVNPATTATQALASKALTQNHAATSFTPVTGGGGTTPLTYSISPTLPSGLSLNAGTGAMTGTPTVTHAASTFTVTVTDANGSAASNTFSLTVNSTVTATQAVPSKTLTQNQPSTNFTPVTGGGGTTPLTYSISPTLPAGLSFNTSTGAVIGSPTATQAATTYTVTVADANNATASNTFSLTVNSAVTANQAIAAETFTQNHAATSFTPVTGAGGTSPLVYSISPTLPSGLSIASGTGAISGTPTATLATTTFTVTVTDPNGASASKTFSLTVNSTVTATQSVASKVLTQSHTATGFTPVTGGGGTSPLVYSISPTLPSGLSIASGTGIISGTPTVTLAATTFTVTVTDGNSATASNTFSLTVNSAVTATQVYSAATLTANHAVTSFAPVTGSGGTSSLTYAVSPSLPAGLSLSSTTGAVSGTPTAASATASYIVTVTDTNGATASNSFALTINGPIAATQAIASTALTLNHAATSFTPVTGAGGTAPLTYSVSPTLPAGLSFSTTTGAITGTPTATLATTGFTVTVTDAVGATATASFSLSVNGSVTATPAIASTALTVARPASSFTPVTGAGGTPALVYSVSPALPTGLSLSPTSGAITGTPAASLAATNFTVTVTDANSASATANFSLTVNGAVTAATSVPTTSLVVNHTTTSFTPVTGNGGTPAMSYSVSPALPAGLNFNSTNGAITGTPTVVTAAVTYNVTVTDSNNSTASAAFSLTVGVSTTTVALASSQNPSSFGQAVTFTASVTGFGGTPGGSITFHDAGIAIGTVPLSAGIATLTTSTLKIGAHTITAAYSGNGIYGASTSPALAQTVDTPPDSVKLRSLQVAVSRVVAQGAGMAITGAIDGAIADGFADGGTFMTPSPGGIHVNFAADPEADHGASGASPATSDAARAFDATGATNGSRINDAFASIGQPSQTKAAPGKYREQKDWLFWLDVRGTGLERLSSTTTPTGTSTTASPLYGHQINALMGLTYKVTPNFLVGALGGYEMFDYTQQDINGKLTGDGWTVGSYLGWRIAPMLRYDAAVAYSRIGYDGSAGTAQGNFNGQRWLVSTGLTGTMKAAGLDIEPSAKVYALWEHEGAYVDSLATQQSSRDFATGRASAGAKVTYPFAWTDTIAFAPYFGAYGDYYFDWDNADAASGALASTPLLAGWSARMTGGLGVKLASGGSAIIGAEYGGLGGNARIWTFTAKGNVPF